MATIKTKYKYAVIATDVVIFTVREGVLQILLMKMKKDPFIGMWALPGGLIQPDESVDAAAQRILQERTGMEGVYLEQLATFGKVDRDPFGRVVSVAYFALVPGHLFLKLKNGKAYEDVAWFSVNEVPALAYDHEEILKVALQQLKSRLHYSNIAFSLLPREFTLTDLQSLYEAILGKAIDKRNFRKNVLRGNLLKSIGKKREGLAHRPARLYQFSSRKPHIVKVL